MNFDYSAILNNKKNVTADDVRRLMAPVKGTTFARLATVTKVKTAAAHREVNIQKVTQANVQMFATASEMSPYVAAVQRQSGAEEFQVSESPFEHSDVYSLVTNKKSGREYLYVIYNSAKSVFLINGQEATREQVAEYLTPSEAKKLLEPPATVMNVTNGVEHNVIIRTIGLESVADLQVAGQVA